MNVEGITAAERRQKRYSAHCTVYTLTLDVQDLHI
jgi:hypothetical protein